MKRCSVITVVIVRFNLCKMSSNSNRDSEVFFLQRHLWLSWIGVIWTLEFCGDFCWFGISVCSYRRCLNINCFINVCRFSDLHSVFYWAQCLNVPRTTPSSGEHRGTMKYGNWDVCVCLLTVFLSAFSSWMYRVSSETICVFRFSASSSLWTATSFSCWSVTANPKHQVYL